MKTLQGIKEELGYSSLNFNHVVTESGETTSWSKQWDNDSRVAILIHDDTVAAIKANPAISSLGLNIQTKQGAKGSYVAKTIVVYKEAEFTL